MVTVLVKSLIVDINGLVRIKVGNFDLFEVFKLFVFSFSWMVGDTLTIKGVFPEVVE